MNDWIWSFKSYISVWIDSIENCDRIPHFLNEKALAYWTRFAWFCAFNLCPFKTFDFDRFDRRDCDRKFVIDADRFGSISCIDFERLNCCPAFAWFWGNLTLRYLFNFEIDLINHSISIQLKFDSIRTGVALYSILSLKLNSFRWNQNLCFYTIHWVETEEISTIAQTRDFYLLCKEISSWHLMDRFDRSKLEPKSILCR